MAIFDAGRGRAREERSCRAWRFVALAEVQKFAKKYNYIYNHNYYNYNYDCNYYCKYRYNYNYSLVDCNTC